MKRAVIINAIAGFVIGYYYGFNFPDLYFNKIKNYVPTISRESK